MATKKRLPPSCETCEFFDWDDEMQDYMCMARLDEDEYYRMLTSARCPFYKFYDEYKSVQKQN